MSCSRNVMIAENEETVPRCQRKLFRVTDNQDADKIPHMADTLQERVRERLKAMDLTPAAASQRAGLSKDFLRKLLSNENQLPTGKTLSAIAQALEISEQWLLTGAEVAFTPRRELRAAQKDLPLRHEMPDDVPVMGTAAGSHLRGAFKLTTDPVDYVRRPPSLTNARNVYSLFVEGNSMEPQYFPGDLIFVHPDKPPRFGDVIVVQCQTAEDHYEATLGIYLKRSAETIVIQKHNPTAEIEIRRATVMSIHKVLTMNEIYGV